MVNLHGSHWQRVQKIKTQIVFLQGNVFNVETFPETSLQEIPSV